MRRRTYLPAFVVFKLVQRCAIGVTFSPTGPV